jgi:hypothetical protein
MAYTVTKLITNAYYLSGIVARDMETVSGDQLSDGLDRLNALLAIKTANRRLIPYFTIYDFTLTAGVESYYIPKLISIDTFTFFIGDVRYSCILQDRKMYFGSGRVNNIDSLPYNYHLERELGGARIYLYFLPNSNFPAQITAKFSLNSVTLNQDLLLTLDQFYIEYLRYSLAEYLCEEYQITFAPESQKRLNDYEQIITDIAPLDLTMTKFSSLQAESGINWADVNIGRGWRP